MRWVILLALIASVAGCGDSEQEDVLIMDWTKMVPAAFNFEANKGATAPTLFSLADAIDGVDDEDIGVVWYRVSNTQVGCVGEGLTYQMPPICEDVEDVRQAAELEIWANIRVMEDGQSAKCESKNLGQVPGPDGFWVNWNIELTGDCP